jgi:hypothetical protein
MGSPVSLTVANKGLDKIAIAGKKFILDIVMMQENNRALYCKFNRIEIKYDHGAVT